MSWISPVLQEVDQRLMMSSEDKRYLTAMHDQRSDHKPEVMMGKDGKPIYGYPPYHYNSSGYPHSSSAQVSATKPEAIFSLYGYPSQQHSTITTEQLQKKGLAPGGRPLKEEKGMYPGHTASPPRAGHLVAPAHHPKDMKPQSSVIVENKVKMEKPVAAHSHHPSSLSSSSSSSPRPQPRPAHTPEQRPDRPLSSSTSLANPTLPHHLMGPSIPSSNSFMAQSTHPTAFRALDPKAMSRSQSPYKMGSGSQPVPVSGQPPQPGGQPQPINFSSKSKGQSGSASPYPPAAIAQPPVSLPASSIAYSYSLIQQGLVPNPMYSQGTMPAAMHMARSQASATAAAIAPTTTAAPMHNSLTTGLGMPPSSQAGKPPQHSPPGGSKRKSNTGRDNGSLQSSKRSKAATAAATVSDSHRTGGMVSVPVTTPQILTNPSPYTTTSNSVASMVSRASVPLAANSAHGTQPITGFMDSFKSFVENTVQNAFLQDEKTSHEKEERERFQKQQLHHQQHQQQQQQTPAEKMDTTAPVSREEVSASPVTTVCGQSATLGLPNSSMASIMDTINRVANGQDTDSDTLSAPSPPPQARSDNNASPQHRGSASSAPKLKKAWLQRHADDKKPSASPLVPSPLVLAQEDSNSSQSTSKEVKHFLKGSAGLELTAAATVNGDVASSPAPAVTASNTSTTPSVNLPNGNISSDLRNTNTNDESTTSASETESQVGTVVSQVYVQVF